MAVERPRLRARGLLLSADDPAGAAAAAVIRFHLRAFDREEAGARGGEVEPVHQLRVATRRLRATLLLFRPVVPATLTRRADEELAWLGRTIGGVRDLDVLSLALGARARKLDAAAREGLRPLEETIRERRAAAHAELVEALDAPRCRALRTRLGAAEPRDGLHLGEVAPELVRPLVRAVCRAGRDLDEAAPAAKFHRLRVRVKRLRYALETLRGLGARRLPKALERLEAVQDLLGDHQDAVTQIGWLRTQAESARLPPVTLMATGAVVHLLSRRARRRRRRFARAWRKLESMLRRGLLRRTARIRHRRAAPAIVIRAVGT